MEDNKFFSKIGGNYLILAIIIILFQILSGMIVRSINPHLLDDALTVTSIGAICNYILPLPIIIYLMRKLDSVEIEKNKLTIKKFLIYVCVTITLMWIGNIIGTIITSLIGGVLQSEIINPVGELINNGGIYVNLLIISIMAPIFEELLFRKLLIDRTIKYGAKVSILLSALLFALFHGNLSQFFYAFLIGGFFAYVYIKTGRLIYTIILHALINFFGSVMSVMFTESANKVMQGVSGAAPTDIAMVAVYALIVVIGIIVGLYTLYKNRNIDLNEDYEGEKIENPARTIFLNVGMVLFILYHIYVILTSLNIISITI